MNYLVVQITEGKLGNIRERATWEDALDVAVKMATEQSNVSADDARAEFEADTDWLSPDGNIHIYIAQAEDD